MSDPGTAVPILEKSLSIRPPAIPTTGGELVAHPGEAPAPKTPFADGLYRLLQRRSPWLAPNQGGGIVATVVLVLMIGVASNQGGIIQSLAFWRWTGVPYWPTWILIGLGVVQLLYVGWSVHEQTAAGNDRAASRHRQAVANYEFARGNDEHRRARELQVEMLRTIVADQQATHETLPTARLSLAFRDTARQVHVAVESARDPRLLPPTDGMLDFVDEAIREVLWSILQFVRAYDQTVRPGAATDATYSANVMLHYQIASTSVEARRALEAELRCIEDGVSIDRLAGVLALHPEWSAIADSDDREQPIKDSMVPGLVLPVPEWRVADATTALPGAPRAWQLGGDFLHYGDVRQLKEHVLNDHCATSTVADAIDAHFRSPAVKHIKSFLSTALVAPEDVSEHGSVIGARPPIGVVNINCSTSDLLREERLVGVAVAPNRHVLVIAPFLRALLYPLAGLIEHRRWVEHQLASEPEHLRRMNGTAVRDLGAAATPNENQSNPAGVSSQAPMSHATDLVPPGDEGNGTPTAAISMSDGSADAAGSRQSISNASDVPTGGRDGADTVERRQS
jgi:hypothetical protein